LELRGGKKSHAWVTDTCDKEQAPTKSAEPKSKEQGAKQITNNRYQITKEEKRAILLTLIFVN